MSSPFNVQTVDMRAFCCADPAAGGCGHETSTHTGPGGECRGVFGCRCNGLKRHKPGCVHQPIPTDGGEQP